MGAFIRAMQECDPQLGSGFSSTVPALWQC